MVILHKIEKLQRLDRFIRLQCTGTPGELAIKLQVSESTLYELLSLAKNLGAYITYNNCSCTYEYIKPMRFVFGFVEDGLLCPGRSTQCSNKPGNNIFSSRG